MKKRKKEPEVFPWWLWLLIFTISPVAAMFFYLWWFCFREEDE